MKLTYTEEQIGHAFDEPVSGVRRFFNEADANREPKEEKEKSEKEPNPVDTMAEPTDDEPKETEGKEEKEDEDKDDATITTKMRKVLNDLQSKKDGYDFISMTDLSVGREFKANDYASLLSLVADKKLMTARMGKSGKSDPEGPDSTPSNEIIFWMKGR